MSDTKAARWLKWAPEAGQKVTLRAGDRPGERLDLAIDELLLTLPEDPTAAPTVQLSFAVDRDVFLQMQAERWFNIPVGFSERAGIELAADRPVEMVVVTAPLERGGYPLNVLFMGTAEGDDDAKLATVLGPFLDPELERPVNNPLFYEVVRVSQPGPDGAGPGFDRAAIEAWERDR